MDIDCYYNIFAFLDFKNIINLSVVNKLFYSISKNELIWKVFYNNKFYNIYCDKMFYYNLAI